MPVEIYNNIDKLNALNISFDKNGFLKYSTPDGNTVQTGFTKDAYDIIMNSTLGQLLP